MKRLLSFLLVVCMLVPMFPIEMVFAEEIKSPIEENDENQMLDDEQDKDELEENEPEESNSEKPDENIEEIGSKTEDTKEEVKKVVNVDNNEASTSEDEEEMCAPVDLEVIGSTDHSVTISWDPGEDATESTVYNIFVRYEKDLKKIAESVDYEDLPYTVENLSSEVEYTIYVQSQDGTRKSKMEEASVRFKLMTDVDAFETLPQESSKEEDQGIEFDFGDADDRETPEKTQGEAELDSDEEFTFDFGNDESDDTLNDIKTDNEETEYYFGLGMGSVSLDLDEDNKTQTNADNLDGNSNQNSSMTLNNAQINQSVENVVETNNTVDDLEYETFLGSNADEEDDLSIDILDEDDFSVQLISRGAVDNPTGLMVVSSTYNSVKLDWSAASTANPTTTVYNVFKNDEQIASSISISSLPYEIKNLTCGTEYTFYIQAQEGSSKSDRSQCYIRFTPKPSVPATLTLTQYPSRTVTLNWSQVDGANGYYVYKSENGGTFTLTGKTSSKSNTTYADKNLQMGKIIEYRVSAYRTVNGQTVEGDWKNTSIDLKPLPPQNVKVTLKDSSTATVTWDALTGADSYKVLRTTTDGGEGIVIASSLTSTSYENNGLTVGTDYYYTVVAVIDGVDGDPSIQVEYTQNPAIVSGLKVTAQSADSITLSWDQDISATRYCLEYKAATGSPASWVEIGDTADPISSHSKITDNVKSYVVSALSPSTVYYFRIKVVVKVGTNEIFGEASTDVVGATKPTSITDLEVDNYDYDQVTLKWTEAASLSSSDQVEIYRADGSNAAKKIDTIAAGLLTYIDEKVTCGTKYTYTLKTLVQPDSTLELRSDASNEVSVTPKMLAPGWVSANNLNATSVRVDWKQVDGANGYCVYVRKVGDDDFSQAVKLAGAANLTANVSKLTPGDEYEFQVAAYRTVSSKTVIGRKETYSSIRVLPEMPKTVKVSVVNATSLKVTWTKISDVTGYAIYMQEENGIGTDPVSYKSAEKVTTVDTNSYTATNLKTGRKYRFLVAGYVIDSDGLEQEGLFNSAEDTPIPTAPTKFTGTSVSSHAVKLSWDAVDLGGVAGSGYEIMRSTDGGITYQRLILITDSSVTEYEHNDLSNACDTRYYKLHTVVPCEGVNIASKDLSLEITPVPATATKLKLSSNLVTEIVLSFNGENTTSVVYYVYRKEGSGSWAKQSGTPVWNGTDECWEFTDTTVKKGTDYTYRVRPVATVGADTYYGAYSDTVKGKSSPAVPLNVVGTNKNAKTIRVSWATVSGAVGYEVQRSNIIDKSGYNTLGTSALLYYDDKTAVTGKTYFYRVRAYYTYGSNNKQYGDWAYLDAPQDEYGIECVPMPPTKFKITSQTYNSVSLEWKKTVGDNCHYRITYDNLTEGNYGALVSDSVDLTTVTYTIKNLKVGNVYNFKIYTVYKGTDGTVIPSTPAEISSVTIVPGKVTKVKITSETPTDVSISPGDLYNKITWNVVNGATGYNIWRKKQGDASFTQAASAVTSSPYYDTDSSFAVGDLYIYYVEAVGGGAVGEKSDDVQWSIKPLPVTGLVVESAGPTSVILTWEDMGVTKYQIYRSTTKDSLGSLIKTVTTTSFTNSSLTCGKAYYYTVKAVQVKGSESFVGNGSTQVKGKPLPLAPTINTVSAYTCLKGKLTWNAVSGVDGYQLAYRVAGESQWVTSSTVAASKTTGTAKVNLTDEYYEFAVRAYKVVNGSKKYGPYSEPSAQVKLEPMLVKELAIGSLSTSYIDLKWKKRGDVTGYRIYICDEADGDYKKVGSSSTNSYKIKDLTPGALTYIKVTSYVTQNGKTIESDVDEATVFSSYIKLGKPSLTLSTNGSKKSIIKWKKITGATGYQIRAKYSGGSYAVIDEISDAAMVQYTHETSNTVLPYNKSKVIYYKVRAFTVQSDGTKVYSSWSSALKKPAK